MSDKNETENQGLYTRLSERQKAIITFNGMLSIVIGSIAGFAWLISLAGYLHLVPLPPLDISVPETKELWRNAHLGPINHGMLIILIAAISSILRLTQKETTVMVYACLTEVWFNIVGFQSAPFTTNRGLTPTGDFINLLSYGTFYVAVVASFTILYLSIVGSYRTMKATA